MNIRVKETLREFRNYTIRMYFHRTEKIVFEQNVLEDFQNTIEFYKLDTNLTKDELFKELEKIFMLNLKMLGVFDILEEYKNLYHQTNIDAYIKAMQEFNRAFVYVEYETID